MHPCEGPLRAEWGPPKAVERSSPVPPQRKCPPSPVIAKPVRTPAVAIRIPVQTPVPRLSSYVLKAK